MKLLSTAALSIALTGGPVLAQDSDTPARLQNFVHTTESGTGILRSTVRGQAGGICNYSRVEISSIVYNVTAKHCLVGVNPMRIVYDVVGLENITETYKRLGISDVKYESLVGVPKVTKISEYIALTIQGKELTAVGCFPDAHQDRMICYTIKGYPFLLHDGNVALNISIADQDRILSHDSSRRRTRIAGMSGSPVFDSKGNLFGVLSKNTNRGSVIQNELNRSFIIIEPVRKPDGTLLIPTRIPR